MIRTLFKLATRRIRLPGTEVIAFPLFEVLDGSDTRDYLQRVEPSPEGGAKMARALMDVVINGRRAAPDDESDGLLPAESGLGAAPRGTEMPR